MGPAAKETAGGVRVGGGERTTVGPALLILVWLGVHHAHRGATGMLEAGRCRRKRTMDRAVWFMLHCFL